MTSWISLCPQWFISERAAIARRYPDFRIDEHWLSKGIVQFYGELIVRPPDGSRRHPVCLHYPAGTPFAFPVVTPLLEQPLFDDDGRLKSKLVPAFFDRRHQMPGGSLCLFQHDTRGAEGGEAIGAVDVLARAEKWFIGHHTGRWPPDSRESDLEAHFEFAGQILLSRRFYGPEINGCGRFCFVRDMARVLIERIADYPPLIMTAIIVSRSGVDAVFDARADLENIFPWLGNDAWGLESLADSGNPDASEDWKPSIEQGYWWTLNEEPPPFHDGAGLLRELSKVAPDGNGWQMVSSALGSDLNLKSEHVFGLRYPGRRGDDDWLIVTVQTAEKKKVLGGLLLSNESAKRDDFDRAKVGCYRAHSARPEVLNLRNTTVVKEQVRNKCVALIGLGALGSKVAELLAQAGIGRFQLCDNDLLTTANVARHIGGLSDFGARKTRVVATRLSNINCYVSETRIDHSITSNLDVLAQFLKTADLTICTTADENVESAINQIAVQTKSTLLYGRALRRGSMGRIFLVRPECDACKACLGRYAAEEDSRGWITIIERDEDALLHECGRPVIPASAVDLSFVASLIARKALDVLEGSCQDGNHWVWSRDIALDVAPSFDEPFKVHEARWSPRPDCATCKHPAVIGVVFASGVADAIRTQVENSLDVETGGILIGYVENSHAVVMRATGPGPKAKRSKTRLERDVDFIQAQLDQASKEFGDRGLYVGEWHSHLEAEPEPSGRDIQSMCGIAEAPNYATECPVMVIAGLDAATGRVSTLKSWSFPVGGGILSATTTDGPVEVS